MITKTVFAYLIALFMSTASAADECPSAGRRTEWSEKCLDSKGDTRFVKREFIDRLRFNKQGVATIMITAPRELVAINRRGEVIVSGIRHTGDFDYPSAEKGIGRFYAKTRDAANQPLEKCGYFKDQSFQIVVPAQFDSCDPFQDGEAMVCKGCVTYCTSPDCQDNVMIGGTATVLGIDGKARRTLALPDLAHWCKPPASLATGKYSGGKTWVHCVGTFEMPE
jgi:hypothetical protein